MFALAISSLSTGAIAQTDAKNDCVLGVVAMLNFAQTNLSTQETLPQLSVDKLKFLITFEVATTPEEHEPLSRFAVTIEGVERVNTQVMAADIQTMRRIYPAVLQKN
jgi:hypothetical protein